MRNGFSNYLRETAVADYSRLSPHILASIISLFVSYGFSILAKQNLWRDTLQKWHAWRMFPGNPERMARFQNWGALAVSNFLVVPKLPACHRRPKDPALSIQVATFEFSVLAILGSGSKICRFIHSRIDLDNHSDGQRRQWNHFLSRRARGPQVQQPGLRFWGLAHCFDRALDVSWRVFGRAFRRPSLEVLTSGFASSTCWGLGIRLRGGLKRKEHNNENTGFIIQSVVNPLQTVAANLKTTSDHHCSAGESPTLSGFAQTCFVD